MGRNSFILYKSFYESISDLSDEELGCLFRAIFEYQLGREVNLKGEIKGVFRWIKTQFETDEAKYTNIVERNAENGAKGGRPKKNPNNPVGFQKPKKADNDNDNDNDSDISTNTISQDNKLTTTNNPSLVVAKSKDFSTESKDSVLKKRAKIFAETIRPYIERYGKEMCREFWEYWTEPNKSHTKMRFEMERTWDIARRLGYWNNRKGMAGKVRAEAEPVSKFREAAEQSARMAERMDERERQQREQESQIDYGALRQISEVRH